MSDTLTEVAAAPTWLDRTVERVKGRERPLLALGVSFQMLVLVGMIVLRLMPHLTGETLLIRVAPVDPRDLFRGDYVILSYEFSRIPAGGIPGLTPDYSRRGSDRQGQTVYVSLVPEEDGIHYRPGEYSLTPPASGKYLRGTIRGWNQLEFGIESYFVQEGIGHKYEDAIRSRSLSAEVVVAPNGQAALKRLRIE